MTDRQLLKLGSICAYENYRYSDVYIYIYVCVRMYIHIFGYAQPKGYRINDAGLSYEPHPLMQGQDRVQAQMPLLTGIADPGPPQRQNQSLSCERLCHPHACSKESSYRETNQSPVGPN